MGLYTTLHIYPPKAFKPSESFLRKILNYMDIDKIEIAAGDKREPILSRIRRKLFPRSIETVSNESIFFENNIDLERGISLWQNSKAYSVDFLLANEGWSLDVNKECEENISLALSDGFLPWDCGITIGPWKAYDYHKGNIIAKGAFSITKSADGNPLNLKQYETAFSELPSVANMLQYLEAQSGEKWAVTCELT